MSAPSTASSSPTASSFVLSAENAPASLDEGSGETPRDQPSPMHISSSPIGSESQENTAPSEYRVQDEMDDPRMRQGGPSGRHDPDSGSDQTNDRMLRAASDLYSRSPSVSQEQTSLAQRQRALPNHPARDRKRRLTSTAEQGRLQRTRSGEIERSSMRTLPHRSVSLINPSSRATGPSNDSGSSWATAIDITSSPPDAGPSVSIGYQRHRLRGRPVDLPSRVESADSTGRPQVYTDTGLPAASPSSYRTGENPLPSLPGEEMTRRRYRAEESSRNTSTSTPWEAAASASMPRPGRRQHFNGVHDPTFEQHMLSGRPRGQSEAIRHPRRERLPRAEWELSGTDERTLRAFLSGGSETQTLAEALNSPHEGDMDTHLPRWQPDAEVTSCPICGTVFNFWYRKHHCRKCGRVVCASCSPHRITIPRQYIVRPPTSSLTHELSPTPPRPVVDLTEDDDPVPLSPTVNPALGGGEEVRLCNPCVPDPNPNPLGYSVRARGHRSTHSLPSTMGRQAPSRPVPWTRQQREEINALNAEYERALSPEHRRRLYPSGPETIHTLARNPPPEAPAWRESPPSEFQRTRSAVPEEDQCPVCGHQFPEISQGEPLEAREAHIRKCIDSFGASSRPRAVSSSARMVEFAATEKDCGMECTICFGEYVVGDVLARLECLCKFHRHCIRDWFKHKPECPTHRRP